MNVRPSATHSSLLPARPISSLFHLRSGLLSLSGAGFFWFKKSRLSIVSKASTEQQSNSEQQWWSVDGWWWDGLPVGAALTTCGGTVATGVAWWRRGILVVQKSS
ncbi:hypothetical protein V2J09_006127 [Rumex salicifolius]